MAEQAATQTHSTSSHHHHHHHKKDSASIFKERSLRAITRNRLIEKWFRIALIALAVIMAVLVVAAYTIG